MTSRDMSLWDSAVGRQRAGQGRHLQNTFSGGRGSHHLPLLFDEATLFTCPPGAPDRPLPCPASAASFSHRLHGAVVVLLQLMRAIQRIFVCYLRV